MDLRPNTELCQGYRVCGPENKVLQTGPWPYPWISVIFHSSCTNATLCATSETV